MTAPRALPDTLALIDHDDAHTGLVAGFLREAGVDVEVYSNSTDLLVQSGKVAHGFYVIELTTPGVDGENLIKILRRRSPVGILVVTSRLGADVFSMVVRAGADMYLAKPVHFEQVALAVEAVHRRATPSAVGSDWTLARQAQQLIAPDGARIDLSDTDSRLLECFLDTSGATVPRETLAQRLGRSSDQDLNSTIFRLRRRIERSTAVPMPLQSKSRVGYVFRANLRAV